MSLTYTATQFIRGALFEIGVLSTGEVPSGLDMQWAFQLLNELLDSWTTQQLTTLVQERHEYALVSGQGGPDNPYLIGPVGLGPPFPDFDTSPAARPDSIRSANLSLNSVTANPVEIPLAIITDDMYAAEQIKSLQTQLANYLYYNRTVPLGQIQLWPIPNTSVNTLVLYTDLLVPTFVTPASEYICPPAYARAIRRNLAKDLLPSFGVPVSRAQLVVANADIDLMMLKEANANAKMSDLMLDPALTAQTNKWGTYNILSDQGSS